LQVEDPVRFLIKGGNAILGKPEILLDLTTKEVTLNLLEFQGDAELKSELEQFLQSTLKQYIQGVDSISIGALKETPVQFYPLLFIFNFLDHANSIDATNGVLEFNLLSNEHSMSGESLVNTKTEMNPPREGEGFSLIEDQNLVMSFRKAIANIDERYHARQIFHEGTEEDT